MPFLGICHGGDQGQVLETVGTALRVAGALVVVEDIDAARALLKVHQHECPGVWIDSVERVQLVRLLGAAVRAVAHPGRCVAVDLLVLTYHRLASPEEKLAARPAIGGSSQVVMRPVEFHEEAASTTCRVWTPSSTVILNAKPDCRSVGVWRRVATLRQSGVLAGSAVGKVMRHV